MHIRKRKDIFFPQPPLFFCAKQTPSLFYTVGCKNSKTHLFFLFITYNLKKETKKKNKSN
uniref:Uncharacterized protein n=1 Tax=Anguilla anguilla TaxID=7936 RepID=A0A0E9X6G3_ANGAN